MPGRTSVTTLAGAKVVASECALAVMTCHATLAATSGMMIERLRIRHLPALRHAGAHLMTLVTSYLVVLHMAEADAKCLGELRRARVAAQLMARAA